MIKVGDRVRIQESITVYHHPKHRNKPFIIKGAQGEVTAVIETCQDKPISANLSILVEFDRKFKAHFQESELQRL